MFSKTPLLDLRYRRRIKCKTKISFLKNHFNIIIPYTHISSQFSLPCRCCTKNCAFVQSVSFTLDAVTCRKYPRFLDMTPCYWLITYRPFGINLHTHLHGAIYSLISVPLDMRLLGYFETSSTNYQVTRRLVQLLMVRRRGFYCGKGKTVRCRTSIFL